MEGLIAQVATGPVLNSPEEVATALGEGHRVYALTLSGLEIVRLHAAPLPGAYAGYWVGASSVPVRSR